MSATIIVHHCLHPPLLLSSTATVFHHCSHHRHSTVSAISCHPLSSFPVIVRRPILRAVVICHGCHPPLPLLSAAAATFPPCSHHCHFAVSAVSCCPLSSFPTVVCRPISHAVIVCHRCCPPPLSSTVTVVIRRCHLPLPQPSSPLHRLHCTSCHCWHCSSVAKPATIVTSHLLVPRLLPAALVISFPNQLPFFPVELCLSSLLPLDVDCCVVNESHVRIKPQQVICDGVKVP